MAKKKIPRKNPVRPLYRRVDQKYYKLYKNHFVSVCKDPNLFISGSIECGLVNERLYQNISSGETIRKNTFMSAYRDNIRKSLTPCK